MSISKSNDTGSGREIWQVWAPYCSPGESSGTESSNAASTIDIRDVMQLSGRAGAKHAPAAIPSTPPMIGGPAAPPGRSENGDIRLEIAKVVKTDSDALQNAVEKYNKERAAAIEKIQATVSGALMINQESPAVDSGEKTADLQDEEAREKTEGLKKEVAGKTIYSDDPAKLAAERQRLTARIEGIRGEMQALAARHLDAQQAYLDADTALGNLVNERWGCTDPDKINELDRRIAEMQRVREEKKRECDRLNAEYERLERELQETEERLWRLNVYGEMKIEKKMKMPPPEEEPA